MLSNLPPGCMTSDIPGNTALDDLLWRVEEEVASEWDATGVDESYCIRCDHAGVDCYQWSMYLDGKCWGFDAEVEIRMEDAR